MTTPNIQSEVLRLHFQVRVVNLYLLCPLWVRSHNSAPQDHEHLPVSEGTVQSMGLHTTVSCDHLNKL